MKSLQSALKECEAAIRDEQDPVRYTSLATRLATLQAAAKELGRDAAAETPADGDDETECDECGRMNDADAVFCARCGEKLEEETEEEKKEAEKKADEEKKAAAARARRAARADAAEPAREPSFAETMFPPHLFPGAKESANDERAKLLASIPDPRIREVASSMPLDILKKSAPELAKAGAK